MIAPLVGISKTAPNVAVDIVAGSTDELAAKLSG
jgi:hypothetical protein